MKAIIKHSFCILVLFLLVPSMVLADNNQPNCAQQNMSVCHEKTPPRNFNPEQFRRDLMVYVARVAAFTVDEGKIYFPLFFEMKDKQRSIEHQKGRALRQAANANMTERDCQRVLNEVEALNAKSQRIEKQFMDSMRKKIGAKKLVKAINADREFGRIFFKQMTK